MDDLDISFPPERIQKILTEVFMFLSHPKLIIISAGNYKNLVDILTCYVRNKINKDQENCLNLETSYKDIAKSFLEKTFAKHSVHVPSLSYEYIHSLKVKFNDKEGKTVTLNFKEFVEQILIIKLLSAQSIPVKILFNDLSVREIILIFREILSRAQKYNKIKIKENSIELELDFDKLSKIPVSELCFSDIFSKIKKLKLRLQNDARKNTLLNQKQKSTEFEDIIYRIKESLDQNDIEDKVKDSLFLDPKKQSLLSLILTIDGKSQTLALFWIWFNENIIFMNGFIRNFPRLLFLEVVRSSIQKDLAKSLKTFITFWKNLNYDLEELAEYFSIYESNIGQENILRVSFTQEKKKEVEAILNIFKNFIIRKATLQLSYEHLFNYFSKLDIDIYNLLDENIENSSLNYLNIEKLLGNFREKLISRLEKSIYKENKLKYALFLAIYINLCLKTFSLIKSFTFSKNIYLQKALDGLEKLFASTKLRKELEWWLKTKTSKPERVYDHKIELNKQLEELEKALPEESIKELIREILKKLKDLTPKKLKAQALQGEIQIPNLDIYKDIRELHKKLFGDSDQETPTYKTITQILLESLKKSLSGQSELRLWKEKIIETVQQSKFSDTLPQAIKELFNLPFIRSMLLMEMPKDLQEYIISYLNIDRKILKQEREFLNWKDENQTDTT